MFVTSDGQLIMYDQGIFKEASECLEVHAQMTEELKDTDYQLTCFKWDALKRD